MVFRRAALLSFPRFERGLCVVPLLDPEHPQYGSYHDVNDLRGRRQKSIEVEVQNYGAFAEKPEGCDGGLQLVFRCVRVDLQEERPKTIASILVKFANNGFHRGIVKCQGPSFSLEAPGVLFRAPFHDIRDSVR